MNKARIENTDEIVIAGELSKRFPNFRELVFVCVDKKCSIRMAPACIKSNKRRPHFKKYRNQEHIDNCEFAVLNDLYQKGKDEKLTNAQINKIGYPSVFHIKENLEHDKNEALIEKEDDIDEGITGQGNTVRLYEFDNENIKFDRRNKVQSIDRIVDWYLGFPYNRDVEIEISGKRIEYQYFFKKIREKTRSAQLHNERIFYGKIMLSNKNRNAFERYNENVFLTLLGYQDIDEGSGRFNNYSIKIDKNRINSRLLSRLRNRFNELFEKAYSDLQEDKMKPNYGLYAFVYGKIDEKDDTRLNVEKHHITFRYDEVRKTMIES